MLAPRLARPYKPPVPVHNRADPLSRGLVALWALGEGGGADFADLTGAHGGGLESPSMWVDRSVGPAMTGFSPSLFGRVPHSPEFGGFPAGSSFGAVALVRPTAFARGSILHFYDTSGNQRSWFYEIETTGGRVACLTSANGSSFESATWSQTLTGLALNEWQMLGVRWDSGTVRLFLDGRWLDRDGGTSAGAASSIFQPSIPLDIGRSVYSTGRYFRGDIAMAAVWHPAPPEGDWAALAYDPFRLIAPTAVGEGRYAAMLAEPPPAGRRGGIMRSRVFHSRVFHGGAV